MLMDENHLGELLKRIKKQDDRIKHKVLSEIIEQFRTRIIWVHKELGYDIEVTIDIKYEND